MEMAARKQAQTQAQGELSDGSASGLTAQTSHIGDASIADSETPLVKIGSSATGTELLQEGDSLNSNSHSNSSSSNGQLQIPAAAYHRGPPLQESDDKGVATSLPIGVAPASKSKKRRIFKTPISTVTSSILANRPRRKRTDTDDALTTTTSQAAESIDGKLVGAEILTPPSSSSDIDRQLGHNDGKGNEGVLRRVYDTWALTSLGVANIGPVAGQSRTQLVCLHG